MNGVYLNHAYSKALNQILTVPTLGTLLTTSGEEAYAMNNEESQRLNADKTDNHGRKPYRLQLPWFITDKDVGLGDVIKRTASHAGIQSCSGCERRAAALNRWFVFSGRHPK